MLWSIDVNSDHFYSLCIQFIVQVKNQVKKLDLDARCGCIELDICFFETVYNSLILFFENYFLLWFCILWQICILYFSCLRKRPRRLLSADGKHVLNVWFIPHYTEILLMYKTYEDSECNKALKYCVQIVSALHDILHYLCAHAKLGSAKARLGSNQPELVSADWGGTEGIGQWHVTNLH